MGKAKSLLMPAQTGKLYVQEQPGLPTYGLQLQAYAQGDNVILQTATPPTQAQAPEQEWQKGLYCDADAFWRNMSPAQRRMWMQYYADHPSEWKGKAKASKSESTKGATLKSSNLSLRGLFMKRALEFNLREFEEEYLGAQWVITSVTQSAQELCIQAQIVKSAPEGAEIGEPELTRMLRRRW